MVASLNESPLFGDPSTPALRPIHYMGNKSRFLDAIEGALADVAPRGSTVCDLFAGTAVVSRRLSNRWPVLSADIQNYSRVLATALTRPRTFSESEIDRIIEVAQEWLYSHRTPFRNLLAFEESALEQAANDPRSLASILEEGSFEITAMENAALAEAKAIAMRAINRHQATLTWYYGGVYFSYRQALDLDALRNAIREIYGPERDATAVAALLGVASDSVSTVGNHFAQPVQPRRPDGTLKTGWTTSVRRGRGVSVLTGFTSWLERYSRLEPTIYTCQAITADFETTLSQLDPSIGAIYADPPYTRDHYSRFYHVLETIAMDDDPGVTFSPGGTKVPSRGLYREDRHQSPFSIRTRVAPAFQDLFAHAKRLDAALVLSYSPMGEGTKARPETRLMSIERLQAMASEYFNNVRLLEVDGATHSRFNRLDLNAKVAGSAEILLVGSN